MAQFQERTAIAFDWANCPLVEVDPRKLSGVPILRGTRMPVEGILENYRDGLEAAEIAEVFELPADSVSGFLAYAIRHDAMLKP